MTLKISALVLVVAFGLALAMGFAVSNNTPDLQAARADVIREQAAADIEAYRAKTAIMIVEAAREADHAAQTSAAVVTAQKIAFTGLGLAVAVLAVGLPVAVVISFTTWAVTQASTIRPTAGGQFPMIRIGGVGWSGLLDPNRTTGLTVFRSPTVFDLLAEAKARARGQSILTGPDLQQPLALSEAATLQLTAQASATAMTAAATRPADSKAAHNARPVVEAIALKTLTPVLAMPKVEDEDPDHIDQLLLLTTPDND